MNVSIGVAGALGPDVIGALAPDVEAAGFRTLWVNDTPGGDALTALAAAGRATRSLRLATGVLPVDRRPAEDVVASVRSLGIAPERLTLGIGSGALRRGALAAVEESVGALRALGGVRIVVGALGPRMRRLAAERADGAVLSWLSPELAAAQADELHDVDARREAILYVRTALDAAATARLATEGARYASYPAYAANFDRLELDVRDTMLDGADAVRSQLGAYRAAVDEVVLRAITPDDDLDSYRSFVRAAAELCA